MIIIVNIAACFIIVVTLALECTAGESLILHWFGDNAIIMLTDFVKNDRCIIRSVLIRLDVSNVRIFNNNEIYVKLFTNYNRNKVSKIGVIMFVIDILVKAFE